MAPLDIEIDWETANKDDTARVLPIWLSSPVVQRIRRLTLSLFQLDDFKSACSLLPPGLQSLEEVHVWSDGSGDASDRELPASLYNLSHITKLTLVDCLIPWDAPIFSRNLTSIYLQAIPGAGLTFQAARGLFSRLSALEDLEISISPPSHADMSRLAPCDRELAFAASLRKLDLTIEGHGADSISFLLALRLPATCARRIEFTASPAATPEGEVIMSDLIEQLFLQHFLEAPSEKHQSLTLDTCKATLGLAKLTPGTCTPGKFRKSRHITIFTSDSHDYFSISNVNMCEHLSHIPLVAVKSIALTANATKHLHSTRAWPKLLPAEDVREVSMPNTRCFEFLNMLATPRHPPTVDQPRFVFPRMEVIKLHLTGAAESDYTAEILALITLISVRQEHDVPLREVHIPLAVADWNVWNTVGSSV